MTEAPLAGVTIRVIGQEAATQSDDAGRFTLVNVRPGVVQLEARRLGYAPLIKADVAVSAGKPVVVSLALTRLQVQLEAVTVRPSAFPSQPPAATPVSSTTLSSEELRRTPGASEDVLQALSIAPGIATTTAGRNDLFVRGGAALRESLRRGQHRGPEHQPLRDPGEHRGAALPHQHPVHRQRDALGRRLWRALRRPPFVGDGAHAARGEP
ncbi:MAG: carboxypeptidase regulatory-like domain-containing protein [Gemmatimonadetes bacterium]|nr:carboxypeptidase regulatory-like domain-containing protein [Gemmatimonadota bacterium]